MAKKVKDPADPGPDLTLYLIYIAFSVVGTLWVALQLGNQLSVHTQQLPINPIALTVGLVKSQYHWPRAATAIVLLVVVAAVAFVVVRRERGKRAGRGRLAVDDKAGYMGNGGAIRALTAEGAREKAEQLGMKLGYDDPPGVPIGIGVADGVPLYGSYEDLHLDIWGPRQGKSTSRVIPAVLEAIGPVIVTSNKRDVVDATRDVRAEKGSPVYVFDPQGVTGDEQVSWYWDPMRWIDAPRPGCEMRAAQLAGHFADADNGSDRPDSFFDPEGEDLLSNLFVAASLARRSIMQVWEWISNPGDAEPIEILRQAARDTGVVGFEVAASGLAAQYNTDPRTKSGIFSTAKKMTTCLKMSNVHSWVTPPGIYPIGTGNQASQYGTAPSRREFDEIDFIERNGTLYSLSLEGRGSAAPLVSALTAAVIDVAIRRATREPFGRLRIPLLAVLDEAANVVRWKDLPKQYSHYGSRGIVVMTVLQSWAQGARCWGEDGMAALWSAANIKVLGSGIDDTRFLTERSEAIGDFDTISSSMSESSGGKSYSRSLGSARTFNVNALVTLPRGRVIVFTSGSPAILVRTVPWWEGEYADQVRRSIEHHQPGGRRTELSDLIEERSLNTTSTPTEYSQAPTYGQPEEVQPL
jgi:type IV secretory pathway TraG/TraD family ATPase VirD4